MRLLNRMPRGAKPICEPRSHGWRSQPACLAVTFINPYGWQLHRHVIAYITDPYQLNHISEFQAVNFHSPVIIYFEPLMVGGDPDRPVGRLTAALRRSFYEPGMAAPGPDRATKFAPFRYRRRRLVGCLCRHACHPHSRQIATSSAGLGVRHGGLRILSASYEQTDRLSRVYLVSAVPVLLIGLLLLSPKPAGVRFNSTYDPEVYPAERSRNSRLRNPAASSQKTSGATT